MIREMIRSLGNVFKKPHTNTYPFQEVIKPKDYRGLIKYTKEECIFCDKCEKVCPPKAIVFLVNPEDGSKTYRYNPYLCIFCSECVRNCPKIDLALTHSEEKPTPGTKDMRVNDEWFEYQKLCFEKREEHKELKAKKREKKQQDSPS